VSVLGSLPDWIDSPITTWAEFRDEPGDGRQHSNIWRSLRGCGAAAIQALLRECPNVPPYIIPHFIRRPIWSVPPFVILTVVYGLWGIRAIRSYEWFPHSSLSVGPPAPVGATHSTTTPTIQAPGHATMLDLTPARIIATADETRANAFRYVLKKGHTSEGIDRLTVPVATMMVAVDQMRKSRQQGVYVVAEVRAALNLRRD